MSLHLPAWAWKIYADLYFSIGLSWDSLLEDEDELECMASQLVGEWIEREVQE